MTVCASTATCSSSPTACCPPRSASPHRSKRPASNPRYSCRRSPAKKCARPGAPQRNEALFFDSMTRKPAVRSLARRRAGVAQPRLPRRHQRRARQHLGRLRRRHQDELRDVPAVRAVPLGRARRRGGQHQGAHLQREGRRPAVPRSRQHRARSQRKPIATRSSACRSARSPASGCSLHPAATRRVAAPDVTSRTMGVTSFFWTIADFCEHELLPFLFADAEDDRQQYTMVVANVTAELRRAASTGADPRSGTVTIDGNADRHVRRPRRLHRVTRARRRRHSGRGPVAPSVPARSTRSSAACTERSATSRRWSAPTWRTLTSTACSSIIR